MRPPILGGVGSRTKLTLDESVAKCNYVEVSLSDWDRDNCAVEKTMTVIGDKKTLLVLREAFIGVRDAISRASEVGR